MNLWSLTGIILIVLGIAVLVGGNLLLWRWYHREKQKRE